MNKYHKKTGTKTKGWYITMAYSKFAKRYDFETVMDRRGLDSSKWDNIPIPGAKVE